MIRLFALSCACGILTVCAASAEKPELVPADAAMPAWPAIIPPRPDQSFPAVRSQDLEILHAKTPLSGFEIRVASRTVAIGSALSPIGYLKNAQMRWLNCTTAPLQNQNVLSERNNVRAVYECSDPDGATWRVERRFQPGNIPGAIEVQTDFSALFDSPDKLFQSGGHVMGLSEPYHLSEQEGRLILRLEGQPVVDLEL